MSNFVLSNRGYAITVTVLGVIFIVCIWVLMSASASPEQELTEFEKRDAFIQECVESERYSREECLIIAGGK